MQATPCGLVTVVGRERPVVAINNPKDANPSNASISVSGSNVNIQCRPEEDSWQLNIVHLQQRVSSRQLYNS